MALLTRQQILNAPDRKHLEVEVPEWGGAVRIAEMTGDLRDSYETEMMRARDEGRTVNVRSAYVYRSIVDENNALLFSPDDVEELGRKSCIALDRVFTEAVKLNRQTKAEADEAPKD